MTNKFLSSLADGLKSVFRSKAVKPTVAIRLTGVLIKNGEILLLEQATDTERSWSLPGGKLEFGESIEDGLKREMREETGLEIEIGRLLYVADHIPDGKKHIVHMTFLVHEVGGTLGDVKSGADTRKIKSVKFIPVKDLAQHGFSDKFISVVSDNFPKAGNYVGPKSNIGL